MSKDLPNGGLADTAQPLPAKRSWLKIVLLALIAIVVVFALVVAMQPDELRIVRSTTIGAPAAEVFSHVNDFHAWQAWSPWAKLDPAAKNTFEGPESGTGAMFKWSGNDQVGEGQMTLTDSQPNDRIRIKLDFTRPMEDTNDVLFTFEPDGTATRVTWEMSGKQTFVTKAFCLIMNIEKTVGEQFSQGLANLKAVVENPKAE